MRNALHGLLTQTPELVDQLWWPAPDPKIHPNCIGARYAARAEASGSSKLCPHRRWCFRSCSDRLLEGLLLAKQAQVSEGTTGSTARVSGRILGPYLRAQYNNPQRQLVLMPG